MTSGRIIGEGSPADRQPQRLPHRSATTAMAHRHQFRALLRPQLAPVHSGVPTAAPVTGRLETIAISAHFSRLQPASDEAVREPQLSPTRSGIGAHCHPSFPEICGVKRRVSSPGMHMSNRTAKFVSAIFASILAGANFAPVTGIHAQAAGQLPVRPEGRDARGRSLVLPRRSRHQAQLLVPAATRATRARAPRRRISSSSTPPASTSASAPINLVPPPKPSPSVRKSVADARAELTVPPMRVEQEQGGVNVDPRDRRRNRPGRLSRTPRAAAPEAAAPSSPVASRWPDSHGTQPLPAQRSPRRRRRSARKPAGREPAGATAGHCPRSRSPPRTLRWKNGRHRCRCCCW